MIFSEINVESIFFLSSNDQTLTRICEFAENVPLAIHVLLKVKTSTISPLEMFES